VNLLFSFAHLKASVLACFDDAIRRGHTVLLDSGAFTMHNSGSSISIDDYAAFLREYGARVWRYINFDKIGDGKQTEDNLRWLQGQGLNPVPVLQPTVRLDEIERFQREHPFYCLGGVAKHSPDSCRKYLDYISQVVDYRRVHILGKTLPELIMRYLPYSCDSSTWSYATKFQRVNTYDGRTIRQVESELPRPECRRESIRNYLRYAEELQRVGVKFFFAVCREYEYSDLIEELQWKYQGETQTAPA